MAKAPLTPPEDFDPGIDPLALDKEWLGQANLFFHWSTKKAAAARRVEEAKQEFDVAKAEITRQIRSEPLEFGIDKVTESSVEAAVIIQREYQMAQKVIMDARYDADIVAAAVAALDHRRRALENLVELHGMQYFSGPVARSDKSKAAMDETEKRSIRQKGQRPREAAE